MVQSAKEAHRLPRGKRATWSENQLLQIATMIAKNCLNIKKNVCTLQRSF
jgi:hypothetical protein